MGADPILARIEYHAGGMIRTVLISLLLAPLCAGCADGTRPQNAQAESFTVRAADGSAWQPLTVGPGQSASVLVFVLQDCPICNGYSRRLQQLAAQFWPRGVRFYLVQVDPLLTDAQALAHAKEYGYAMPVLVDRRHELVRKLGVVAVPTAVVVGSDGAVRYKGRIDNRYFALGKSREAATTDELHNALQAVVEHRPPPVARTRVVGCAVPDLPQVGNAR